MRHDASDGPPISGSAFSLFGSTAEITGVVVYDGNGDPLGEDEYTLVSQSGCFDVPPVTPAQPSNWSSVKSRY
jgi:hypothetical protein